MVPFPVPGAPGNGQGLGDSRHHAGALGVRAGVMVGVKGLAEALQERQRLGFAGPSGFE